MKIGIIGLTASGKTTLFNALTRGGASTGGYRVSRVNVGAALVADSRVDALSEIFRPKKTTYASVNFVDAQGVGDAGAAGNAEAIPQALEGADALLVVVRAFEDAGVPHPKESINPARDLADVRVDLILRDLSVVERRLARLDKLVRVKKDPAEAAEFALLGRIGETLEEGRPIRLMELDEEQARAIKGFGFLSAKPLLVVVNVGEDQLGEADAFAELDGEAPVALAARLEEELAQLAAEERAAFLADYALESSALDKVIRASFALLNLRCFFTVGEDEVRAWSIRAGMVALHAAGTIHSDLERGFIRAEVVAYPDFMAAGSLAAAREKGTFRLEGKDHVVQDGDWSCPVFWTPSDCSQEVFRCRNKTYLQQYVDRGVPAVLGYRDSEALAGAGALAEEFVSETARWHWPENMLRYEGGAAPENVRILRVRGNSMEPKMREGDRIVVDVSCRFPSTGETFVLWDGNGLVVKQVEAVRGDAVDEDEPPRLRLISANPDYAPYSCLAQDVHILGKVLWVVRRV